MAVFHLETLKKIASTKLDLFKREKKTNFVFIQLTTFSSMWLYSNLVLCHPLSLFVLNQTIITPDRYMSWEHRKDS